MKTRNELIEKATELGLTFARTIAQTKSVELEAAIAAALGTAEIEAVEEIVNDMTENVVITMPETTDEPEDMATDIIIDEHELEEMPLEAFINAGNTAAAAVKKTTIADEIMQLANSGMSRVQIHKQLQATHPKINYRYVVQTLLKAKAAGIEINVPRQERVFAPKPDAIEALEAKLAKMKAAVQVAAVEEI